MRKRIGSLLCALSLGSMVAGEGSADELTYVDRVFQSGVLLGATSVVVSPDGNFLYSAAVADSAIGVFARNHATGALTFSSSVKDGVGGIDGIGGVITLLLSDDGNFLYAASTGDNAVTVFARNAGTGALTKIQALFDGQDGVEGLNGARQLALSPDGDSLYVAGYFDGAVTAFERDPGTGLLTFLRSRSYEAFVTPDLGNTDGLAVSPDGGTIYVGSPSGARVFLFTRSAGDLFYSGTTLYNDDLAQPLRGPDSMRFSPDGAQLYIAAEFSRAITIFGYSAASALTNLGFVPDGAGGSSLRGVQGFVFDSAGTRLYGATLDPGGVVDFARDPQTGALAFVEAHTDLVAPGVFLNDCGEPALSPDDAFLYVPDTGGQIAIFAASVPEPESAALVLVACAGLAALRAQRSIRAAAASRARGSRVCQQT